MKKPCVHCDHPVSGGSDRHAKANCPPKRKTHGNHAYRKRHGGNKKGTKVGDMAPKRGESVAGIHKVSASSDRSRSPKKPTK